MFTAAPAIEALLVAHMSRAASAAIAGAIGGLTWNTQNICSQPAPEDPVITQADWANLADFLNIVSFSETVDRFKQLFVHLVWPAWCDCDNQVVPPPQTIVTPPPYGDGSGLPSGATNTPCWDVTQRLSVASASQTNDLTPQLLPYTTTVPITPPFTGGPTVGGVIPPGTTQVFSSFTLDQQPVGFSMEAFLYVQGTAGSTIQTLELANWNGTFPLHQQSTITLAAGATSWILTLNGDGSLAHAVDVEIRFTCTGQPPGSLAVPCCPPDPTVDARLGTIVQLIQILANQLLVGASDLVDSTTHIGLSNSGTITLVNSCAAIRVSVTAGLEGHPNNPGSPNYYFSLGFITSIAAGSPLKGWRLVYGSQTFPLAAYADQVGYTLAPGVMVNITELLAS